MLTSHSCNNSTNLRIKTRAHYQYMTFDSSSRRQWDGMIKAWKKSIHKYDQPKGGGGDAAASNSHSSGENR